MKKIFISYAHEDTESARRLYNELHSITGIKPWFDKECLQPGMKWQPAIRKNIRESSLFFALLSKCSTAKKGFINTEMREAIAIWEQFPDGQIFLIPIRLEECQSSFDSLREIQHVDFFPDWDQGFRKVLKTIEASPDSDSNNETTQAGYEYRCALLDLDNGFANLPQLCQKLNSIQRFFHFTAPVTKLKFNAVRLFEDEKNLAIASVPNSLYKERDYLNTDLVACLTRYPLAFESDDLVEYNYFAGPSDVDETFMFISTHLLYDFTKQANRTFEKGLLYIVVQQLLVYFTNLLYHDEIRGCLMDFCEDRTNIVKGLKKMSLCSKCKTQVKNEKLMQAVEAILADELRI